MYKYKYKYMYIGERNGGRHNGIVSIGSYITINGDNYNIHYNLTFCSKADQFIKSISRKIIEGRFKKFEFSVTVDKCNFTKIKQNIIEKILCDTRYKQSSRRFFAHLVSSFIQIKT